MDQDELPSPSSSLSLFLIGKDGHGNWVVQDPKGLRGGLFIDRAEAIKFAMYGTGNRPQAVIMVPGTIELHMSGRPNAGQRTSLRRPPRRAAWRLLA